MPERYSDALRLQSLARRLDALMQEKELTQSDLARLAFGEYKDPKTGYMVAYKRDRVSAYLNGRQFPDTDNLKAIAKALDVTPEELAPELTAQAVARYEPEFYVQEVPEFDQVLFKMEKLVHTDTAYKIIALLAADRDRPKSKPGRGGDKTKEQIDELYGLFNDIDEPVT
jgi:transcriptional regulator with XRE-family HTH domain